MRECGGCTLCCKVMGAPPDSAAFIGPSGTWCEHCDVGVGCRIHAERPDVCRAGGCLWLAGAFGERDRPDKTGVVFWIGQRGRVVFPDGTSAPPVRANESYQGAAKRKRTRRIIDELTAGGVPVLVEFEGDRTFMEPQLA
jgi:hypothetical protein